MSRPPPTLPMTSKMYRHFAMVTAGIMLCLGMFAQGEGREAVDSAIAKRESRNQTLATEAHVLGKRTVAAHGLKFAPERRAYLDFAPDPAEFDQDGPVNSEATYQHNTVLYSGSINARSTLPPTALAGSSAGGARVAATPSGPVGQRAIQRPKPRAPTAQEIARLAELSRARAGSDSGGDLTD